jgi:hypothetical protein
MGSFLPISAYNNTLTISTTTIICICMSTDVFIFNIGAHNVRSQ